MFSIWDVAPFFVKIEPILVLVTCHVLSFWSCGFLDSNFIWQDGVIAALDNLKPSKSKMLIIYCTSMYTLSY